MNTIIKMASIPVIASTIKRGPSASSVTGRCAKSAGSSLSAPTYAGCVSGRSFTMNCEFCNKKTKYNLKVSLIGDTYWEKRQCCFECREVKNVKWSELE